MATEPDNIVLQYLYRFDEKLDRVVDEMLDVKVRLTAVEEGLAGVIVWKSASSGSSVVLTSPSSRIERDLIQP